MGMIANYMLVDTAELDRMNALDGEDLVERIDEMEDDEDPELYCMDKLWDGLHFLLTGVSADEPPEGDKLSEAVVGVHVFDVEPDDGYVGRIENGELPEIVAAMEAVDMDALRAGAAMAAFRQNEIYPNIWEDAERESLLDELAGEFRNLLDFYKIAQAKQMHVIVSIF